MELHEKIRALRMQSGMTQEELAERIFVTRTAVSKWETGKGYPGIDSLKLLSELFHVSLDELISQEDIDTCRRQQERAARRMYWCAVVCLAVTVAFALAAWLADLPLLLIGSLCGAAGYVAFALLAKPRYKRARARENRAEYIASRVVLALVFAAVAGAARSMGHSSIAFSSFRPPRLT